MLHTWEWWTGYGLRTHMYPLWLSLPGQVLKAIGMDTNFLIVNSVYFQHMLILVLGDYYGFKFVRQLVGRQEAIICLIIALIHEHSNNYILRTSVNGVESSMLYIVFYHYINMRPQLFNRSLMYLTMAITVTFIVRSSSIIGYLPLALMAIFDDQRYFVPIVVAGLTVTIPMVATALYIDSYFYGYWIVPQFNFVYFNVVEGLSNYFGLMPWYYYFNFVKNEFCQIETFGWPVLFLASYQQYKGTFTPQSPMGYRPKIKGEQESSPLARYPFLIIYAFITIIVLSLLDHKE